MSFSIYALVGLAGATALGSFYWIRKDATRLRCASCGAWNSLPHMACNHCGQHELALKTVDGSQVVVCESCGKQALLSIACKRCGHLLLTPPPRRNPLSRGPGAARAGDAAQAPRENHA